MRAEAGSQALEFALVVPLLGLLLALLVQTGLVLADVVVAQGIAREVGRTAAVDGDGPARRLARELAGSRDVRVELVERDGMVTARLELATGAFAAVGVDLWLPATATFRVERPVPADSTVGDAMWDGLLGRARDRRWVRVGSRVAGGAPGCGCGAVSWVRVGSRVAGGAPGCGCGAVSWVRVGSRVAGGVPGCGAASVVGRGPWRSRRWRRVDDQRGSVALLAVLGGGLALLIALVPVVVVADLMVTRARAQTAADAAALAAMADPTGEGRDAAVHLGRVNAAEVLECCGRDPGRRDVTAAVRPASWLLPTVMPRIEARAAAALVAASSGVVDATAISPGATVTAGAVGGGARVWPVAAPLTSGFGVRTHPITGTRRLHAGIDLGAPAGTPIRAADAGLVVAAGPMGGYGNTVDVAHADGTTTRYAHQSRVLVRAGQQIAAGQVIGLVGSTGASTGPHLHFEVRTPAGPTDPRAWLP